MCVLKVADRSCEFSLAALRVKEVEFPGKGQPLFKK